MQNGWNAKERHAAIKSAPKALDQQLPWDRGSSDTIEWEAVFEHHLLEAAMFSRDSEIAINEALGRSIDGSLLD